MIAILSLFSISISLLNADQLNFKQRIDRGENVKILEEYPYVAFMRSQNILNFASTHAQNVFRCGTGVLIGKNTVLTSARNMLQEQDDLPMHEVQLGTFKTSLFGDYGERFFIKMCWKSPEYYYRAETKGPLPQYNIAIVQLDRQIEEKASTRPVSIDFDYKIEIGDELITLGFGFDAYTQESCCLDSEKFPKMTEFDAKNCTGYDFLIEDWPVCNHWLNKPRFTDGDNGAPILRKKDKKLVAINSGHTMVLNENVQGTGVAIGTKNNKKFIKDVLNEYTTSKWRLFYRTEVTQLEEYPYVVYMRSKREYLWSWSKFWYVESEDYMSGSGVLISPNTILTCAHSMTHEKRFHEVQLGALKGKKKDGSGETAYLSWYQIHPEFYERPDLKSPPLNYDIAIVGLKERIVEKPSIKPVLIDLDNMVEEGESLIMLGFGSSTCCGNDLGVVKWVEFKVQNCTTRSKLITEDLPICNPLKHLKQLIPYEIDEGGPVLRSSDKKLVAINSVVSATSDNTETIHPRLAVGKNKDFLKKALSLSDGIEIECN